MMSELHWTGAVLLLSIAVHGGSSPRARRDPSLDGFECARRRRIVADLSSPSLTQGRREQLPAGQSDGERLAQRG